MTEQTTKGMTRRPLTANELLRSLNRICALVVILGLNVAHAAEAPPEASVHQLQRLKFATATLTGYWREEDALVDDEESWIGSATILMRNKKYIILLTNRHCLGLESLVAADPGDGLPEIVDYSIKVSFPSGITKQVKFYCAYQGDVDLALLYVEAHGVGDIELLSWPANAELPPVGRHVVAVGCPIDPTLEGTHTFGRVSAIREVNKISYIQTDAAVNHGNSGGPLFERVSEDKYRWVGIVTMGVDGANNLGLATTTQTLLQAKAGEVTAADAATLRKFLEGQ